MSSINKLCLKFQEYHYIIRKTLENFIINLWDNFKESKFQMMKIITIIYRNDESMEFSENSCFLHIIPKIKIAILQGYS